MDPYQCLTDARRHLSSGYYDNARESLSYYREWRAGGGFEPPGGDMIAAELQQRLEAVAPLPQAPDNAMLMCDMTKGCREHVTHIGNKGYIYCAGHAAQRKTSGVERCRKLTATERQLIEAGKPIRYERAKE